MSVVIGNNKLIITDSSLSEEFTLNWMCQHLLVTNIKIGDQSFDESCIVPQPLLWQRYFGFGKTRSTNEKILESVIYFNDVEAVVTYKEIGPKI